MNCVKSKQLEKYFEEQLTPLESRQLEEHVAGCSYCRDLLHMKLEDLQEFEVVLNEISPLPNAFTYEIESKIKAREVDDLENRRKKKGLHIVKKLTLAAAGLAAAISLGVFVSPTFASYVNSLFNIEKYGYEGAKIAAEKGFSQKLDMKVVDKGITIEAKEILVDSLALAVIVDAKDQNGKKIPPDDLLQGVQKSILTDKSEKKQFERTEPDDSDWYCTQYGDYIILTRDMQGIFTEQNPMPAEMLVHLTFNKIGNTEGKWQLKIPVDMTKANVATKQISVNEKYTSPQGVSLNLKDIEILPSATLVSVEAKQTKELEEKIQSISKEKGFRDDFNDFKKGDDLTPFHAADALKNTGFAYQLLDERGTVIAGRDDFGVPKAISIDTGSMQGGYSQNNYTFRNSFLPIRDTKKLTFKLHAIYTNEATNFQARLNLSNLSRKPFTKKDAFGNTFTFKGFKLKEWELNNVDASIKEEIKVKGGLITYEATLARDIMSTDVWSAKDETGKVHEVYSGGYLVAHGDKDQTLVTKTTKDEKGLVHIEGVMAIEDIEHQPKELTLSYHTVKKQHRDVDWKVDIPLDK
ncbi:DUF4179 domain-containing protein [Aneurinibacillus aneurinilyticus]|uniref:DUF4179 domain-containing protein n=1 Tax=Aneurinibacillus aneurinilyticus ATCC 12856 TaxID=649747 RepID=U1WQP5_ANEAE|nr:DUF4179 domain-containing protein [Aneurinibacillus aneurinilyticus]ERI10924.1 hypothetical protein HMPREF0083_00973 [Aneurinibacillus aneurinilyticus ATCC 12856]MED0707704.1 DUF4179 domain-containing protein [Aneurinibacillus aneurinilyticus]MED0721939.1 DUF4179 domain-containing protein [Aneurinibacillus aneurinilyticus]MED0742962.1 DUF4179 domain-containing protein [Aneurinibacillus aneurinilyticus]